MTVSVADSSSVSRSAAALTVTVWGVSQLETVNSSVSSSTVKSVPVRSESVSVTSWLGTLPSTTVKLALPPSGTARGVVDADTTISTASSSITLTGRSTSSDPYPPPMASCVTLTFLFAASSSWLALTVTVCAWSQFDVVKLSRSLLKVRTLAASAERSMFTALVGSAASATV